MNDTNTDNFAGSGMNLSQAIAELNSVNAPADSHKLRGLSVPAQVQLIYSAIRQAKGRDFAESLVTRKTAFDQLQSLVAAHAAERAHKAALRSICDRAIAAAAPPDRSKEAPKLDFAAICRANLAAGGISKGEAVKLAVESHPQEHRAYLQAGGGEIWEPKPKQENKSGKSYAGWIAHYMAKGLTQAEAIDRTNRKHPEAKQEYIANGGGPLDLPDPLEQ